MMPRRLWLILLLVPLFPVSVRAIDPDRRITQYAHAAWRVQDGFFTGTPWSIVQTPDGYLWLGTDGGGLLRFDGVRFVPWKPDGNQGLPSSAVLGLRTATDGSLWIGTRAGLSRLKNQALTNYSTGVLGVASILEDRQGTIWFGQAVPAEGSGPLCRVLEAGIRCLGIADGMPTFRIALGLLEDPQGNLWVGGDTTLVRWRNGSRTVYEPTGLKTNVGITGITSLASTPDGTFWVGIGKRGPGLGLQRLVDGRWESLKLREFDSSALVVSCLHVDRQGALWIGTEDRGLYRIHGDRVDHFDSTQGLSNDYVNSITEDREGNLWVTTFSGVDRFTDTPVVSFSTNEGLCSTEVDSVLASRDGSIWVGGDGALSHLRGGTVSCIRTGKGLPGSQVTSLFEDHLGRLWVGIDHGLWVYDNNIFHAVNKPDKSEVGLVRGIAEDTDDNVWITAGGPPGRLMRIQGLSVRDDFHELPNPRRVAADPEGGIWLGLWHGDLARYHNGKVTTYPFAHDENAVLNQVLRNADGSVFAATTFGVIAWQGGKQMTLTTRNGLPCDHVTALTFDDRGNLWMAMDCGVAEVTSSDLEKWRSDTNTTLNVRTLDVFDGAHPDVASFVSGARSPDGRVWFASLGCCLQAIDPARLKRNSIAPPVHIEQIVADRKSYPAAGTVRLPPHTRDLQIDYVGLSFVVPQKVLFRYWLEGRDASWQEPVTRRQAFYNDLRPGPYRFRVIASNNDGVWNEEGATLDFVVAAAWYQTRWFLVLCVVTGVLAIGALYQLRVRQVARALSARFDERLGERIRVARDIHDTLLQTVQGSKMVADNALNRPGDAVGLRRALEQVSGWLGQASTEGRAAVTALRVSTRETNDLAQAFRRAIDDCQRQGALQPTLSVTGEPREMHPLVRDEVYRIAYEAIRNACTHAGGHRLEVGLTYARDLTVRVSDDGVGINPEVAAGGREGHFGLQGMRERAGRIGAKLAVVSSPGSGTEITLVVPGHVIFRRQAAGLLDNVRARFRN